MHLLATPRAVLPQNTMAMFYDQKCGIFSEVAEIFLYRITAVVDQSQCRVDCSSYPHSLDAVSDVDPGVALPQPRLGVPGHDSVLVH